MFLEDDVLSYFQVPKFWKTVQQKFFEIDFKKVRIFLIFFWNRNFSKKLDFNWNFSKNQDFENFRFSKIFNWNPTFSKIFDFKNFQIFSKYFSNRSQKFSTEPIFKILVSGKSWDSPPQKTFTVRLANAYSKRL